MSDAELAERLAELEARLSELSLTAATGGDLDVIWIIVSAVLVFFMQVGFAMVSFIYSGEVQHSVENSEQELGKQRTSIREYQYDS